MVAVLTDEPETPRVSVRRGCKIVVANWCTGGSNSAQTGLRLRVISSNDLLGYQPGEPTMRPLHMGEPDRKTVVDPLRYALLIRVSGAV